MFYLENQNMDKNTIRTYLRIMDFKCPAEEITRTLGVQPTRTWREGELRSPGTIIRHKENGWELSSGISDHESFEEHTLALLRVIEPNLDAFIQMGNEYTIELSCAIRMYYGIGESTPWLGFDKHAMKVFAKIDAEVDFDLYTLPGEP